MDNSFIDDPGLQNPITKEKLEAMEEDAMKKENCKEMVISYLHTCFSSVLRNKFEVTEDGKILIKLANGTTLFVKSKSIKEIY